MAKTDHIIARNRSNVNIEKEESRYFGGKGNSALKYARRHASRTERQAVRRNLRDWIEVDYDGD